MKLSNKELQELTQQAQAVLNLNWRDGYTVPSPTLYPFQWHWDSGFIALGFMYFDLAKAKAEIRSMLKGQWKNGLLPHIIFHKEDKNYFPGPEMWQSKASPHAPEKLPTSGIIQPPVLGFVLEMMLEKSQDKKQLLPFIEEVYPRVLKSHQYLYEHRDPRNEGLIYIQHNWEAGMDNSPLWDEALKRIEVDEIENLSARRRDVKNVDAAERPSDFEYQRYLYLVNMFIENRFDDAYIAENCPFLIQGPLINSILIRSNQSLIALAKLLGLSSAEIQDWNELSRAAMNRKLWNAEEHRYDAYDLAIEQHIPNHTAAGLIAPLFANVPDAQQADAIIERLEREFAPAGFYRYPCYSPNDARFEPQRYWRGPVWINMNWLLYKALQDYHYLDLAEHVKADSIELIKKYGFYEYFDPRRDHGQGYGGAQFAWSAALFLDLIHDK